jgi:hypothetical protein
MTRTRSASPNCRHKSSGSAKTMVCLHVNSRFLVVPHVPISATIFPGVEVGNVFQKYRSFAVYCTYPYIPFTPHISCLILPRLPTKPRHLQPYPYHIPQN